MRGNVSILSEEKYLGLRMGRKKYDDGAKYCLRERGQLSECQDTTLKIKVLASKEKYGLEPSVVTSLALRFGEATHPRKEKNCGKT